MAEGNLPLSGIRVVEFGSTVAAPAAARLLADFGAEVIKVEPPEGDHLRTWGQAAPDGTSWWFKSHNRNKQFVALDLRKEADRTRARQLAISSDVVLENFRPGRMAEWGLGYEELAAEKPGIVYVSISGYGQSGPYSARPGFGHIAEGMSGMRFVTGYPDRPPVRVGLSIGDEVAGLYAAFGAIAALRARDRHGIGDHVDVSLIESLFSLSEGLLPEFVHASQVTERSGNRYLRAAPSGIFKTRDGKYLSLAANSDPIFRRFASVMKLPELASDPSFATNRARVANVDALEAVINDWMAGVDLDEALFELDRAGVPAGPIYSVADIAADPQFRARGAIGKVAASDGESIATPGIVPAFRNFPGRLRHAAGAIGADQEAYVNAAADHLASMGGR